MPTGGLDIAIPAALTSLFGAGEAAAGAGAAGLGAAEAGAFALPEVAVTAAAPAAGAGFGAGVGEAAAGFGGAALGAGSAAAGGGLFSAGSSILPGMVGQTASSGISDTATGVGAGAPLSGSEGAGVPSSTGPSGGSFLNNIGKGITDFFGGSTGGGGVSPQVAPSGSEAAGVPAQGGGVGGFLGKNWPQVAGLGLAGINFLKGNEPVPGQAEMQRSAAEQGSLGRTLSAYQLSGTLPPGMKAIVDQNSEAAKAAIRSQYAKAGYSNSSAENQALAQVDQASMAQIAQIADHLAQQGRSWISMSNAEFDHLLQTELASEAGFQKSLASFAGGLAGLKG